MAARNDTANVYFQSLKDFNSGWKIKNPMIKFYFFSKNVWKITKIDNSGDDYSFEANKWGRNYKMMQWMGG